MSETEGEEAVGVEEELVEWEPTETEAEEEGEEKKKKNGGAGGFGKIFATAAGAAATAATASTVVQKNVQPKKTKKAIKKEGVRHVTVVLDKKQAADEKKDKLMEMLGGGLAPPIIIFCNGKRGCDVLGKSLDKQGFPTAVIHSGKDQATREQAIDGFKSGEFEILVATDIAGRGIDVEGVEHVINYDMPKDIESYTHRIGRTGRAGRKGAATTFVTGEGIEENVLYDLKLMLEKCKQPVPLELSRHPACVSWLQVRPV